MGDYLILFHETMRENELRLYRKLLRDGENPFDPFELNVKKLYCSLKQ